MKVKNYRPSLTDTADFTTALCLTDYGKFHYEIIAVCAVCILTVGSQNSLSAYVFPAAQCELKLTSFELGLLNVSFLLGGILSSFLWGTLADVIGRRKILITAHFLNASVTVLCAFILYPAGLVICRFLNGFLMGAPGSIIFSYLAEFQPPKYRSSTVCYCGLFFTLSWLVLPVCAYLILPIDVNYQLNSFLVFTSWRLFLVVLALPEILVAVWFLRMPESPKFYMAQGETKKALVVLRTMYSRNTGVSPELYPVKQLISDVKTDVKVADVIVCRRRTARVFHKMLNQSKNLFRPPLVALTTLTCSIMFSNMFGVFGMGLWLPDLFIKFQKYQYLHPNSTVTVKQLASIHEAANLTCTPSFDPAVIESTLAMATSSLVYNAVSSWLASRIQPKIITMVSMMLGGISAGCIYWMTSAVQNLVVACVFQASMITANMTIGSIVVELFPTRVAGMALCLIMCAGRLGASCSNVIFGYLMDKRCEIPIFVVAAVVIVGGALCSIVPSTGNHNRPETNELEDKRTADISVIS